MNIAVVVIAYNRPNSLKRLLETVANAYYKQGIDLVISIDGGGDCNAEVLTIADDFDFKYGHKRIINHPSNLGLKKHVISCGNLVTDYDGVILLEEDCIVSPHYYNYTLDALSFYDIDDRICGISLYTYKENETCLKIPFYPLQDGNDVFFMQVPSSWGQAFSKKQWTKFYQFYLNNSFNYYNLNIPHNVLEWPDSSSWKKILFCYMIQENLFFAYNHVSLSSNCGDKGTHFSSKVSFFQVPLLMGIEKSFKFISFSKSNSKYDAYMEILPECLKLNGFSFQDDFVVDLQGLKDLAKYDCQYALSIKEYIGYTPPMRSYGLDLHPIINNLLFKQQGDFIFFDKIKKFDNQIPHERIDKIMALYNSFICANIERKYYQLYRDKYYKLGYYILNPKKAIRVFFNKIKYST